MLADALPRSSADLNGNESSASVLAFDDTFVPTLARWSEVHAARQRVVTRILVDDGLDDAEIVEQLTIAILRSWGVPGPEVGQLVGMDRFVAERRYKGIVRDVLAELGGEAPPVPDRLDAPPAACLKCGQRPRIRSVKKVRVLVDGRRQRVVIDRQTSLCGVCLAAVKPPAPQEQRGTLRALRSGAGTA
ncbi:MAG: hypothetical protein ACSLFR_08705 [Solirubrobacteraceae bacterium]